MNSYLLDTRVLLWWDVGDERLAQSVRGVIEDSNNKIVVSVVSAWEIQLKSQAQSHFSISKPVAEFISRPGIEVLDVQIEHVTALTNVKIMDDHKNPFDRLLVAQAKAESLTLITHDKKMWAYDVPVMKC